MRHKSTEIEVEHLLNNWNTYMYIKKIFNIFKLIDHQLLKINPFSCVRIPIQIVAVMIGFKRVIDEVLPFLIVVGNHFIEHDALRSRTKHMLSQSILLVTVFLVNLFGKARSTSNPEATIQAIKSLYDLWVRLFCSCV